MFFVQFYQDLHPLFIIPKSCVRETCKKFLTVGKAYGINIIHIQWWKRGAEFGGQNFFCRPPKFQLGASVTAGDSLYLGTKCSLNSNLLANCMVQLHILL